MFVFLSWSYCYQVVQGFMKYLLRYLNHQYCRLQNIKYFNNYSILWYQNYITMFLSMRTMWYLPWFWNCQWVEGAAAFSGDKSGFLHKILRVNGIYQDILSSYEWYQTNSNTYIQTDCDHCTIVSIHVNSCAMPTQTK